LFVKDSQSRDFLHQPAFAKLCIVLVGFASAILESLNFGVYLCESVSVLLIVHDVSLQTRILLLVRRHCTELTVHVADDRIIDDATAAFLVVFRNLISPAYGVLGTSRGHKEMNPPRPVSASEERMCICLVFHAPSLWPVPLWSLWGVASP